MTIVQFPGASIPFAQICQAFADAMQARGLVPPPEIIADGGIHRCDARGKRGKDDGAYLLFANGKIPAGGFQNWKDGHGWENWSYDLGRQTLTAEEIRELQQKQAAAARERAEQEAQDVAAAQQKAQRRWFHAKEAQTHPYLERKRVSPNGTRIFHGALVVPARTIDGVLRGLPAAANVKKRWMWGSRKAGAFHWIGSAHDNPDRIVIAEGFATAASVHAATGHIVLTAFDCYNLKPVAEVVRKTYPRTEIIIAADDDRTVNGNPGIHHALDAALAVGGLVADPNANGALADKETDFNDLAVRLGADAVREVFQLADKPAEVLERRLVADPFSAFKDENVKAVIAVKERDRAAFERLRDRLKQTGARIGELDELWGEAEAETDEVAKLDKKQTDILVRLAGDAQLFHAQDGTAYADIRRDGHRETCALYSRDFKRWLKHCFYRETGSSPGSETFNAALGTIEAKAIYEGPEQEVYLRIAGHGGNIYIDLGDPEWRVVEVTATGWSTITDPPVRFHRPGTLRPLPIPVHGGSISKLRQFINVPDDDAFVLLVAYILAAMRPVGPYPVLSLHGPAGTAKSTLTKVVRCLIDYAKPALRSLPREIEAFFIAAHNNHVLAFENISFIPPWIADLMCQLSTGGGYSRRELYTAMDETVFDAQRPQILNGIEDFVVRGDLADRAIPLLLETIPAEKRRHEKEFWDSFEVAAPLILGALLDAVANGLRHLPTTELPSPPRMADFALWATACETGAPWVEGVRFMDAYTRNRAEATSVVLEDDIVAQALRKVMADLGEWDGTATVLLARLTETWHGNPPDKWPRAPHKLTNRIRRIMPQLAATGLTVKFPPRTNDARKVVVTKEPTGADGGAYIPAAPIIGSPQSSVTSVTIVIPQKNKGLNGDATGDATSSQASQAPSSVAPGSDASDATADARDARPGASVAEKTQQNQGGDARDACDAGGGKLLTGGGGGMARPPGPSSDGRFRGKI
jgi:phage/plasmid primase-like uncharacterized protein